jgi:hypothetical protein
MNATEVKVSLCTVPETRRLSSVVALREAAAVGGGSYDVVVVREGLGNSDDRNVYTAVALRDAVARGLFEGLRAYADHPSRSEERDLPERSVRSLVGNYREARFDESGRCVRARLQTIPGASYDWVRGLIESAIADLGAGLPPKAGISIDGTGVGEVGVWADGEPAFMLARFTSLPSADVVTSPGAGGMFVRRLSESMRDATVPPLGAPLVGVPGWRQATVRESAIASWEALGVPVKAPSTGSSLTSSLHRLREAAAETASPALLREDDTDETDVDEAATEDTVDCEECNATGVKESGPCATCEGTGKVPAPDWPADIPRRKPDDPAYRQLAAQYRKSSRENLDLEDDTV